MHKKRLTKIEGCGVYSFEQVIEEFLLWKKAEGRSTRTIQDYGYHLKLFLKRYPDVKLSDIGSLKNSLIHYMGEEVSPCYYNNKLVYLRTFLKYCVKENIIPDNPLEGFSKQKTDNRIVKLDERMLQKLLTLPDKTTFSGLRDYGLMLLQLDTGIRPNEALSLQKSDVNLNANEVHVKSEYSKTGVSRTLHVSPITVKAIQKLISVRTTYWGENVPIFCTCEGTRLSVNGWYKRVKKYGDTLGT